MITNLHNEQDVWMRPTFRIWLSRLGLSLLLVATVAACGGTTPQTGNSQAATELKPVALGPDGRLRVVATTNIVGNVVSRVGGDQIALTTLMAPGVDPHSYVPTPANSAAIHDAHVVFANGLGLEAFLEAMIQNAGGDAVEVRLSDGLAVRPASGTSAQGQAGDSHDGVDPHVWFDVQNVIHWTETIRDSLSTLDPSHAQSYATNAEAYTGELKQLDAWILQQIATIPDAHRKLVTNHPAFGYLADRYGLEQLGAVYPISPSAEPSARDMAALEDTIRTYGVPAVFTESTVNPRLAEQIAQDTGVRLVQLYTGSLGGPGSDAETYIDMMRYDVTAIVQALK
jgi:ABC-type Zn uptake system ZnuABC Zn-binding protein ZnuA